MDTVNVRVPRVEYDRMMEQLRSHHNLIAIAGDFFIAIWPEGVERTKAHVVAIVPDDGPDYTL